VAVLVLTMHEEETALVAALRAGARGYLLKSADRRELANAINTCAAGGMVIGGELSGRLAGMLGSSVDAAARTFPSLTPRERQILDRLARGENNETIAHVLGLSQKTVRNQVSTILNKLAVPDRAAAIVLARDAGVGGSERRSGS
jgi:DNA-binding NarL/FixJ family response regulator